MLQNLNSYDKQALNEIRYKMLCKLHHNYVSIIKYIVENVYTKLANEKVCELDYILEEIENLPISWEYYKKQKFKFIPDFENLIIFIDDKYI